MKREEVGNSTCMMARVKKRKNHSLQGIKREERSWEHVDSLKQEKQPPPWPQSTRTYGTRDDVLSNCIWSLKAIDNSKKKNAPWPTTLAHMIWSEHVLFTLRWVGKKRWHGCSVLIAKVTRTPGRAHVVSGVKVHAVIREGRRWNGQPEKLPHRCIKLHMYI